jgi:hypothetical protein
LIQYTSPKQCVSKDKCVHPLGQHQPIENFYPRGKSGYLCSECKDCMKARSKRQKPVDRKVSVVPSEGDVITQLLSNGIPALPGKALHQQWADVIAWGCVLIEVKSSALSDRQFSFGFSHDQRNGKLRGDLIVLVCRYDDKNTYHVFPSSHPMFYGKTGKLKTGVNWTPQRKPNGKPSVVTDDMMSAAENKWQMIEDYRLKIAARLMVVQELPIRLVAA